MSAQDALIEKFLGNIETICTSFIAAFGLKHDKQQSHLSSALLRWLDFRLRYVDPVPRRVFLSNKFPKHLTEDSGEALKKIHKMIVNGEDINSYQGRGLIEFDDTSDNKKQNRTDLLWADWGIIHLHLTNKDVEKNGFFSKRAEWLLFCFIIGDTCFFIDIRNHNEKNLFSNRELIEILIRNWPTVMARYQLVGVMPPKENEAFSSEEIGLLRKSGISSHVSVDGVVYMGPGQGVTSAATSSIGTRRLIDVNHYTKTLAEIVLDPAGQYQNKVKEMGIIDPIFELAITPKGMAVYETKSTIAFLLKTPNQSPNILSELDYLVAPGWAVNAIISQVMPDKAP